MELDALTSVLQNSGPTGAVCLAALYAVKRMIATYDKRLDELSLSIIKLTTALHDLQVELAKIEAARAVETRLLQKYLTDG